MQFKNLRNSDVKPWLNNFNFQIFQQSFLDLDKAYGRFFKSISLFPKFKSKKDKSSARFTNQCIMISNLEDNKLNLTKNLNGLKFKCSDKDNKYLIENRNLIQNITLSKNKAGEYYASICIERINNNLTKPKRDINIIGLDLGIKELITLSSGEVIKNNKYLKRSEKKLKKLQKRHSKKVNVSKNKERSRVRLAKVYNKITNQRKDFLHKSSSKIVNENQVIILEDLNIAGMVKNHSLAKAISDASWSELVRQIEYKSNWYGREIIKINRFYPSTKTCSFCGEIQNIKLSERVYNCGSCGLEMDRDLNAAKNILAEGIKSRAAGAQTCRKTTKSLRTVL
jgi:putative transposase